MKLYQFLFFLLVGISSCKQGTTNAPLATTGLKEITTIEKQKIFLEDINDLDQKVRNDGTVVLQTFGHNSKEHLAAMELMNQTDEENLKKIEQFLETYGHPSIKKHGLKASEAPWLVIHHAPELAPRERNFKHLYQAWKNGDLEGGKLIFYLNRFYSIKYGNRLQWDRPFTEKEEIDSLLQSLELSDIAKNL